MNALVAEYRSLPASSDHLPDTGPNDRKWRILSALDSQANTPEVSQLLLDILSDRREFDLARVEAIEVVGVYIEDGNPLAKRLRAELLRIATDATEDEMLRGWAQRYVEFQ